MSLESEHITETNATSLDLPTESSYAASENTEQSSEIIQQEKFRLKEQFSYDDDEMTSILFEDEDLKNKLDLASWLKFG